MGFALYISEKDGVERQEVFDKSEIVVGRVQGNDLMLPKGNVSKRHAKILARDGQYFLSDLKSTNGTYVNGRKISQDTLLREGDKVYVGDFVLRFEARASMVVQETATDEGHSAAGVAVPSSPPTLVPPLAPVDVESSPPSETSKKQETASPPRPVPKVRSDVPAKPADSFLSLPPFSNTNATLAPPLTINPYQDTYQLALELLLAATAESIDLSPLETEQKVTETFSLQVESALQVAAEKLRAEGDISENLPLDRLISDAHRELFGLGPLDLLLHEEQTSEIHVIHFNRIFVHRGAQVMSVSPTFTSQNALRRALARVCFRSGRPIDDNELLVERKLPLGVSLSAILSPLSEGGDVVQLRRRRPSGAALDDLVRTGVLSPAVSTFLSKCLSARANVLLVAPHVAGTSPIFGALLSAVSKEQRVAVLHHPNDTAAVSPHFVSMSLEGSSAPMLVRAAAAMSFPHVFVDLVSGKVASSLLAVIGEGARGIVAEFHAPSLLQGLERLVPVLCTSQSGLLPDVAGTWLASAFDVVIEVGYLHTGRLAILRVAEPVGFHNQHVTLRDIFAVRPDDVPDSTRGVTLHPSDHVPRVLEELRKRGVP